MKKLKIFILLLFLASSAKAGLIVYTDQTSWENSLSVPINVIDWDDLILDNGTSQTIAGNHYSGLPGSPTLAVDSGSDLFVIDPGPSYYEVDFFPVSGENVFSPDSSGSPQGILTISFDTPMSAIGVWFLDVEYDFDATGIEIGGTLNAFSSNQGDNSQSFLGIISSTPFTSANIHMSSDPDGNGVGIDDVMYAVPVPGALLLGLLGLGAAGIKLRRHE